MKKKYSPLFISFKWCMIPCWLYAVVFVIIKYLCGKSEISALPILLIWLILKVIFILININYIKQCTEAEHKIWRENNSDNINIIEIQKKYPKTLIIKKLRDSFILTNMITIIFLLYGILNI